MRAEARAEVDAEDLVRADDYYHSRPYFRSADKPVDHYARFCSTPAKDFYKKPVLCAAHVVGIAAPVMYGNHRSYNSREVFNKQLKLMHDKEKRDKLKDEIIAIQADRRNALDTLAYERAKFRADCAARNIKTSEDAERAYVRIAAARADVVSQDIALQACDFK